MFLLNEVGGFGVLLAHYGRVPQTIGTLGGLISICYL